MAKKTMKACLLQLYQALYRVVVHNVLLFPKVDIKVIGWQDQ